GRGIAASPHPRARDGEKAHPSFRTALAGAMPAHDRNHTTAMLHALLHAFRRIVLWTFVVGGVSFAIGFFGPMIVWPESNQGPLFGILISGPYGTLAGLAIGVFREIVGWRATPVEVLRSTGLTRQHVLRGAAGIGGVVVLVAALRRFPNEVD